jgi:hypothetical protein
VHSWWIKKFLDKKPLGQKYEFCTGLHGSAGIVDTSSTSEINELWKQGYNHPLHRSSFPSNALAVKLIPNLVRGLLSLSTSPVVDNDGAVEEEAGRWPRRRRRQLCGSGSHWDNIGGSKGNNNLTTLPPSMTPTPTPQLQKGGRDKVCRQGKGQSNNQEQHHCQRCHGGCLGLPP